MEESVVVTCLRADLLTLGRQLEVLRGAFYFFLFLLVKFGLTLFRTTPSVLLVCMAALLGKSDQRLLV